MGEYILEVNHATKIFDGLVANEDITFNVKYGEIVGVVGPNGAGKTTLFNSLSGAHSLTSGQVIFQGENITKLPAYEINKRGMGRTFQIPQSINELTVFENIMLGAMGKHSNMHEVKEVATQVMQLCGLNDYKNQIVGSMNVIQKKRIEIARALATQPKLLLLDETMAGLSNTERAEAVDLIMKINETGVAILTIEHMMDVVMNVSNRVVVIQSGKLICEGTPEEVTSNPQVISAYLGGGHSNA